jgi:hypothetical protein
MAVGAECCLFDQFSQWVHMSNIDFITRIGQGLLAVAATGATVVVLQFAMLA